MDMNAVYEEEVRAQCPKAEIVYDLFGVVAKYGREVIDRVRVAAAHELAGRDQQQDQGTQADGLRLPRRRVLLPQDPAGIPRKRVMNLIHGPAGLMRQGAYIRASGPRGADGGGSRQTAPFPPPRAAGGGGSRIAAASLPQQEGQMGVGRRGDPGPGPGTTARSRVPPPSRESIQHARPEHTGRSGHVHHKPPSVEFDGERVNVQRAAQDLPAVAGGPLVPAHSVKASRVASWLGLISAMRRTRRQSDGWLARRSSMTCRPGRSQTAIFMATSCASVSASSWRACA